MKNRKPMFLIISIIIYTLLVIGITFMIVSPEEVVDKSSTKQTESDTKGQANDISFDDEYNWISLPEIDLNEPGGTYNIKSLTSEAENVIDLRSLSDHEVQINGENVSGQKSHSITIDEISSDNQITLTIDGNDYTIRTLPTTLTKYDYENNGAEDGFFYFSYSTYIVKMNTDGQVVYYNDVGSSFDFKLNQTEDGTVYYSYLIQSNTQEQVSGIGFQTTKAVIMDEEYNVVDEVRSRIPTDLADKHPLENHEFVFIDLNHYIISSYYPEEVHNIPTEIDQNKFGSRVIATTLQEVKDGKVLWEWQSTEHPELYELSIEHNDFTNEHSYYSDYVHFNSLAIDPSDQNVIISARNMSSIIKLSRETGEVMWVLGGKGDQFGLTEEQKFSRQHKLSFLSDGTILLFNNGNVLPKAPYPVIPEDSPLRDKKEETSIMQIKIGEEKKEVLEYKDYPTGEFSGTRGSAQMLNEEEDIILIGWGSRENNDATFTEMNFSTGEELFVFYPNDESIISYRAYKYDQ